MLVRTMLANLTRTAPGFLTGGSETWRGRRKDPHFDDAICRWSALLISGRETIRDAILLTEWIHNRSLPH